MDGALDEYGFGLPCEEDRTPAAVWILGGATGPALAAAALWPARSRRRADR